MFENRSQPLLPRPQFVRRLAQSVAVAFVLIVGSLIVGMVGYRVLEGMRWIDAFLNASMLLGGMGPVNPPLTVGGKLFAGAYALYCGSVVILIAGLLIAPFAHRFLHKFHLEAK